MTRLRSKKEELEAQLQSTLQKGIEAGVPALSAAICSARGPIWQSFVGLMDVIAKKPIDETHIFGIGSITKVFVAVVILQLMEEKSLALSDTLGDILDPDVFLDIKNGSEATIDALLSHTAGVESWEDDPVWIVEGRGKELYPEKIWTKTEPLDYIRRPNPSGPEPGQWSYSSTNYTLLGLVIEEITEKTTESEIRRRILDPLGMEHTYLEGYEKPQPDRLPRRYHWATEKFRETAGICPSFSEVRDNLIDATGSNLSVEWTAGGIVSSPLDLLKFAIGIRDGKLLSPSSLGIMKAWRPTTGPEEMGHGLFRYESPAGDGRWLGHFGSVLGFTGSLLWKEEGDCAVAILANVGTMHAGKVPSSAFHVLLNSDFFRLASELAACQDEE